jgi:hypothetical protein
MDEQLPLFSTREIATTYRVTTAPPLEMTPAALQAWKQRVFHYQQQVMTQLPAQQGSLFDLPTAPDLSDPDRIDPFQLPQQNTEFWRWKADAQGIAALYFVIDYELPILLYVGETVKSNQRWKGEHDCKRYLLNYRQAHYQQQTDTRLGIAFWAQAPTETRPRQKLESALIYKWRSPFNKENWEFWNTPFVGGK